MRRALLLATIVLAALAAAPAAHAQGVILGIADQKTDMFGDARFAEMGIKHARVQVPWDVMTHPDQLAEIDVWLAGAQRAGVQPLISFGHSRSQRRTLPSPSRYKYEFRSFRPKAEYTRGCETARAGGRARVPPRG